MLFSPWRYLGACGVCALPVEQSSHSGSSHRSAGLVEESLHPEDVHLSGSTCLPSGHAGGLQRSVTQGTLCYMCNIQILKLNSTLTPVLYSLYWFYCRRHSGPSLNLHAIAPPNIGEGGGTKLPACSACRRRGDFCSFESTGTGGDTDGWGWHLNKSLFLTYGDCWRTRSIQGWDLVCLFVSAEAKFSSFWNLILDEKKPIFTTEKFLSQASEESKATYCTSLNAYECFKT